MESFLAIGYAFSETHFRNRSVILAMRKAMRTRHQMKVIAIGYSACLGVAAFASFCLADNSKTILFVDDEDILYRPGTMKRVVEFKKSSLDPVIVPDKPWEGMIGWTSCYRDPQSGKYQLWYQAYQPRRVEDKSLRCVVCYAESHNGLNWTKPELDLVSYFDHRNTNIVLVGAGGKQGGYGDRYCNSVVVDDLDSDAARRYKMLYYDWHTGADADKGAGTHVAFSPDGIHWTKHSEGSVSKTSYGGKGVQPPFADQEILVEEPQKNGTLKKSWQIPMSMSDAMDVFFDPKRRMFVSYGKMWVPGPDGGMAWKHGMGRIESLDFIHWSKPELVLTTNDRDPPHVEFHTSPVFFYNQQYLSLNQILDRSAGTIDVELMSSRDGLRWDRSFANSWIISRGAPGKFDSGSLLTNGTPIILDDELRFYYGAYRGTAVGGEGLDQQVIGSRDYFSGVGLATTPRDRFVAIGPNPKSPVRGQKKGQPQMINTIGQVTLRPRDLKGVQSISLNADASRGTLRVEILNEEGYRLHGFTKDECMPINQDGLALEACWKARKISDLPAGRYQVRIHLDRAELFAVTFQ
jgi:hypothetical protein